MRIVFTTPEGGFDGDLFDHPVAADLVTLLPVDLPFEDFNAVEKVARLPHPLTSEGMPDTDEPLPGEIGYYAPTQGLVLYYGHVGRWPGLVRIGRFNGNLDELRTLPSGTHISITLNDS